IQEKAKDQLRPCEILTLSRSRIPRFASSKESNKLCPVCLSLDNICLIWYITWLIADGTCGYMVFATRLSRLRTQRNFSQREIAERIGVPKDYVALVERGQTVPSLETLERFAKALDVPLHKLFYDGRAPTTRHLTPR